MLAGAARLSAEAVNDVPPANDAVAEPPIRRRLSSGVAVAVFVPFIAYYSLVCYRPDWGADFQLYCAGIARLYQNMLHPSHEAMALPGEQSTVYTLYLVVLAVFGKVLGLTPFRVLQIAGVFNLAFFVGAACFLASRWSIHRRWLLSAACFIYTTLFLRWIHFGWSSETSLTGLQYLQSYPSTFAWSLAFVAFALFEDVRRKRRLLEVAALVLVLGVMLLTHVLTASWVIGIMGLYSSWWSVRERSLWPVLCAGVVSGLALLMAIAWPYAPFFAQSSMRGIDEGSDFFGRSIWHNFPNLYGLALPSFAYLWWRLRRHGFWFVCMLATLGALMFWRYIGYSFGNRYALFALFFPQFVVADVMALGIFALAGPLIELPPRRVLPRWDRPGLIVFLIIACVAWVPSPMLAKARQTVEYGKLASPAALLRRPSSHDIYQHQYDELLPYISPDDIVMMPVSRAVFDFAALTGASVVAATNAHRVPDRNERIRAVYRFFNRKTKQSARIATVERYGVTKILVTRWQFNVLAAMTKTFGEPIHKSDKNAVFVVKRIDGVVTGE